MDYSIRYGRLRALLRQIRLNAGLSQAQLAEKLGKPQTFVSKSELGERRLDLWETMDFCSACGVDVLFLLKQLGAASLSDSKGVRQKRRSPRKMDTEGRLSR